MGPVLNSGFLSMKGWEYCYSPLDGMLVHRRVTPSIFAFAFEHLGEEKHCESKVSCLRTQYNDPGQGSNPDHPIRHRASPDMNWIRTIY